MAVAMIVAHTAAPGALSVAVLSAQACMIGMVVLPLALGVCLVALTRRRWQGARHS